MVRICNKTLEWSTFQISFTWQKYFRYVLLICVAYNIVATWLFSYGLSINILFKKFSMHSLNRRRYSLFHTRISYDPFNTSWFPTSFDFQYYILLWHDMIYKILRVDLEYHVRHINSKVAKGNMIISSNSLQLTL